MKKVIMILVCLAAMVLTSCGQVNEIKNKELFKLTDEIVNSLYTTYESYGLIGGEEHIKYTSDKEYKVFPIGRLVNVRIERLATDEEYEELRKDLELHYKGNYKVNNVYRCQAGTIMIDCRK